VHADGLHFVEDPERDRDNLIMESKLKDPQEEDQTSFKNNERDFERDSVETYKDLTKLLISLATGTFVLAPAIFGFLNEATISAWWSLYTSSILLVISILCGIVVLSTLAGSQHANTYNIDDWRTRIVAIPQWITFISGLTFFMIFVYLNLGN